MRKISSYLLIICISILTLSGCKKTENSDQVQITFHITEGNLDTLKIYQDDFLWGGMKKNEYEIILDSMGMGTMVFEIPDQMFATIEIGETYFPFSFLLQNGHNVTIKGHKKDLFNTLEITGEGASVHNFQLGTKKILEKYEYLDSLYFLQLDSAGFYNRINAMSKEIDGYIHEYFSDHKIPDTLQQMLVTESNSIEKYLLLNYHLIHYEKYKNESVSMVWDTLLLASGASKYAIALALYHDFAIYFPFLNNQDVETEQVPQLVYNTIQEADMPEKFKDFFISRYLYFDHLSNGNLTPEADRVFNQFQEQYPGSNYMTILEREYEKNMLLVPGSIAPEITGVTIDGKSFLLSDLMGKTVYIDVWATWCPSCVKELPVTMQLEKELSENSDVAFLYVSVEDLEKWRNYVSKHKMGGYQINAQESSIYEDYLIRGVPRYIIIDKMGKIVNANAPKPSSEEARKEILGAIGSASF